MALYSSSVEYGLHCLLYLAMGPENAESKATSVDLAEIQGVSASYVAKLFTRLKNGGIVNATEGASGGYQLARPSNAITMLEIIDALEDRKHLFLCRDIRHRCALFGSTPPTWATKGVCSIHAVMLEAEQQMRQTLKQHTLADVAAKVGRKAPKAFSAEVSAWFDDRSKGKAPTAATRRAR